MKTGPNKGDFWNKDSLGSKSPNQNQSLWVVLSTDNMDSLDNNNREVILTKSLSKCSVQSVLGVQNVLGQDTSPMKHKYLIPTN